MPHLGTEHMKTLASGISSRFNFARQPEARTPANLSRVRIRPGVIEDYSSSFPKGEDVLFI